MKVKNVSFTGELEVFKSPKAKAPIELKKYFKKKGEADKLVKTLDKDLNVTVYMPKNGDVFLRFEHSLSNGKVLGVYKFAYTKLPEVIKYEFKEINILTNALFKKYMSFPNAGDLIRKEVLKSIGKVKY